MKTPLPRNLPCADFQERLEGGVVSLAIAGTKQLTPSQPVTEHLLVAHTLQVSWGLAPLGGISPVGLQAAILVQVYSTCLSGPASLLGRALPMAMAEVQQDTPSHTSTFHPAPCITSAGIPRLRPKSRSRDASSFQDCRRVCKLSWQSGWIQKKIKNGGQQFN